MRRSPRWSRRSSPGWHTTRARRRSPSSACRTGSAGPTGRPDISFTLPRDDGQTAMAALRGLQEKIGFESLLYDDRIGKVSLIGRGMGSHPGVTATFFGALAEAGVNIEMVSSSEIRISVVVDQKDVDAAVNATHKAFDLDAGEVEAVVYGGTGR